jgi:TonB-linked SusC/RagA family outer membrane protein
MKKKSECNSHGHGRLTKLLLIMKITLMLVFLCTLTVSASVYSQSAVLNLNLRNATVRQVLDEVEKQSQFKFFYLDEQIDVNRKVNVAASNEKVEDILASIFDDAQIKYKVFDNNLVVLTPVVNGANVMQNVKVSGKVTDAVTGEALLGVNIVVEGTTIGVVSDIDGNFSIEVPSANAKLVFSFVGYTTQSVAVNGQTVLNVALATDAKSLEEVVVVGYGVQKKKLTTGANLNVKGETIQSLKTTSAMDALKGITPGVNITQSNGQPGAGSKVYIRGIGTTGDAAPLYIVDGVSQGNIDFLNPSDIESIDVLKDAASAAIYGSRAANGVILVTTKQGKKNMKPSISYDGYYGVQNVYKTPDVLNAKEYAFIMDESVVNQGLAPHNFANLVPNWDKIASGEWEGTNWFEEMRVKDAPIQSHALGIQGGTEKTIYSIGASYLSQDGIIGKQTDPYYKRMNLRLNTENILFTKGNRDILTIGEKLNYSRTSNNPIRQGGIYWNDVHNALTASPFLAIYDDKGKYTTPIAWDPTYGPNPIGLMDYNTHYAENKNNQIVGSAYLVFQPIKNFVFRSSLGINAYWSSSRSWIPAYNLGPVNKTDGDQVTQNMSSGNTTTWDNTLTYTFKLKDHNFVALIGNSVEKNNSNLQLNTSNRNSLYEDWEHAYISNTTGTSRASFIGKDNYGWGMLSYFGRISYDYKETYLLSAMMRADGSSKFTEDNRWGVFPSVSVGWVMSNESFMQNTSNVVNFLKIRGSWGQVGNQNIRDFLYSSTMSYQNQWSYYDAYYGFGSKTDKEIGSYPARIPNPDITWETSEQLNIGFDAYFLNSKLQASFDWYKKDTKDWLVDAEIPTQNGIASMTINGGQVTNKGIELALTWNDNIGDFKYGVTTSLSHNKNEVTDIANSKGIIYGPQNVLSQGTSEIFRAQEGYPIGSFWGFVTDGIMQNEAEAAAWVRPEGAVDAGKPYYDDQKPGDLRFVDQNKDGVLNDNDKVMIGDPNPDYILGIQLNFDYKGLFLNATANGAFGQQIAKSYRSFADSYKNNYTTDILGRWHGEGTSNKIPRLNSAPHRNTQYISDLYIQDGDYLRISNITVGYDFKKLFKALPFVETRLYVTGKNLYTFTKYDGMDPEIGYGDSGSQYGWASGVDLGLYPSARTFLVGLSLKF